MFSLQFSTRNAAFNGDGGTETLKTEVARILRQIADDIQNGENDGKVRDISGNPVGTFWLTRE